MNFKMPPDPLPLRLAAGALIAEIAHLVWEHLHGGIATHHFLRSADLPGFSNAWGLLLLPALAAWAGFRIRRRIAAGARPATIIAGGLTAALFGLALSMAFSAGREDLSSAVFFTMLAVAALLPVCRAECWLGLVLGMAFTFGAVIPTVIGGVIALLSALIHLGLRPLAAGAVRARRRRASPPARAAAAGDQR